MAMRVGMNTLTFTVFISRTHSMNTRILIDRGACQAMAIDGYPQWGIGPSQVGSAEHCYKAVFLNKLSDAGQEASRTQTWLEFALACKHVGTEIFESLDEKYEHIFAMLFTMEQKADSFCTVR